MVALDKDKNFTNTSLADTYPILMEPFLVFGKMIYLAYQAITELQFADGSSSTATGAYKHEYEAESSNDYYHHVMHFLGRGPSNDAPPYTAKQDS